MRASPSILPTWRTSRANLDGGDGFLKRTHASRGGRALPGPCPYEVRIHLARGLDRVWEAPCTKDETCHHGTAFHLAVETMRDCVSAAEPDTGRRQLIELADPVDRNARGHRGQRNPLLPPGRGDPALALLLRPAFCVSGRARELLTVLLAAHRRSLLSYDDDMDDRGTHALIAARALLTIAADGDKRLFQSTSTPMPTTRHFY